MRLFFLFIFYVFSSSNADPKYENSTNICQRCTCQKSEDAQTLNLDCTNQSFSYMLANWPEHNSTLKVSFSGNNFTSLERLPETEASLEIVLSRCNIHVIFPGVFESTTNVKFVDLSRNFITSDDLTSDKFRGPYNGNHAEFLAIEDLNLAYNQIHSLHKDIFEYLPNLTRLNLEGNDFVVLDVHTQLALTSVRRLKSLNLANNELTELVGAAIDTLASLTELDLSKNSLDFVPSSLWKVGKSLQVLILDDNPIIELTSETFPDLHNLIQISANNLTKLKTVDARTFHSTPKLTKLSICNNTFLREIDSEAFSPDSALKEFYISNNSLSTIPYELLKWDQLDVFDFNNNPLDCNCDLYRISTGLSNDIKRNLDGPTCVDPRSELPVQVYSLQSDICSAKVGTLRKPKLTYNHMSIQLAGLFVSLTTGMLVAIILGYSRYKRFMQNRDHPFASQVIYSPLLNAKT